MRDAGCGMRNPSFPDLRPSAFICGEKIPFAYFACFAVAFRGLTAENAQIAERESGLIFEFVAFLAVKLFPLRASVVAFPEPEGRRDACPAFQKKRAEDGGDFLDDHAQAQVAPAQFGVEFLV
jgi:hypothetical protein